MKSSILFFVAMVTVTSVGAAEKIPPKAIDLSDPQWSAAKRSAEFLPASETEPARLKLVFKKEGQQAILTIKEPGITQQTYMLRGKIRYRQVQGEGYVEMLHVQGDIAAFSRTMSTFGPMQKISEGDAEWRKFIVPMHRMKKPAPDQIDLNVRLNGSGEIELAEVELIDGADDVYAGDIGGWWTDSMGGLIGGICGSLIGCWGALLGWLESRNRFPSFIRISLVAGIVLGIMVLLSGLAAALIYRQPYGVWYPLTLIGFITSLFSLVKWRSHSQSTIQRELQQMNAMDVAAM